MKKRILCILLAIACVCAVPISMGVASAQTRLLIGTGGLAGVYYPIGGAIAKIISSKVKGVEATVQTSAAGMENLRLLSLKEIDMGLVQNSDAYNAFNGKMFFKDKPIKNIRGIAVLYPQPIQIVVRANSGIKSFYDLKGKRVGVGAPGSGEETTFRRLLTVHNMTYDDIDEKLISLAEQAAQFKDRHIDAMWYVSGVPTSGILDVSSVLAIKLVPIKGKERDALIKKDPYFIKSVVAKGSYPGLDEDVETIASPAYLVCLESLKEDDVYQITKAIFENLKDLAAAHKQGENVRLETALIGSTIPLHPGAEKYYKEKGVLK
ncbi:MAG: TAXI family TRAP transporter solute-binding subunit [Deltaproteobacteria bacterium]|nr:TAXI family TRAP transporter solute-binding subunit [Deltaproteobacteria bacterium]MBW2306745.1 TAXI family TRAP transporter solute-binding subunit [Deltaproteobacteria bacterium]